MVAGGFEQPLLVVGDPVEHEVLYVVEKTGVIKRLGAGDTVAPEENWLEIEVDSDRHEIGLLGLAFHPDYEQNGLFYVSYNNYNFSWMVTEFRVVDGAVDYGSARNVYGTQQAWSIHNGGMIQFGPDGLLYISVGDGGPQNDECQNGQNGDTHRGSILRIDVEPDGVLDEVATCGEVVDPDSEDGTSPCRCQGLGGFSFDYTIPPDNPFVGNPDIRDEIYAYGFRNPWRFAFDQVDGQLFVADTGQVSWEEVSVVQAGGNYGWSLMEGNHCFAPPGEEVDPLLCDESAEPGQPNEHGFIAPVAEYAHSDGRVAVIGIGSYRSCEVPAFAGRYFFGDWSTAEIWSVTYDGTTAVMSEPLGRMPSGFRPTAGGYNARGDVFVIAYPVEGFSGPSSVYRITGAR